MREEGTQSVYYSHFPYTCSMHRACHLISSLIHVVSSFSLETSSLSSKFHKFKVDFSSEEIKKPPSLFLLVRASGMSGIWNYLRSRFDAGGFEISRYFCSIDMGSALSLSLYYLIRVAFATLNGRTYARYFRLPALFFASFRFFFFERAPLRR